MIALKNEDDVREVLTAEGPAWEPNDPRLDATTALIYTAKRFGVELYYNPGREEFYLSRDEHGTNLAADSVNAILNAALTLDLAVRCLKPDVGLTGDSMMKGQTEDQAESENIKALLEELTTCAERIGNHLDIGHEEGEMRYCRYASHQKLYNASNAFKPKWKKRAGSFRPKAYVFNLEDELDMLEQFIAHDEAIYAALQKEIDKD